MRSTTYMIKLKLKPIHEVGLVRNMVGVFVCILALSLLLYILVIHPMEGDKASSLANMFSFAATLFAPVAAILLINNWKHQVKHEKLMDCLAEVFKIFRTLHIRLLNLKLEKKYHISPYIYNEINNEDFKNHILKIRSSYKDEINEIKELYYDLNKAVGLFVFLSENEEEKLIKISDEYFRITHSLEKIYFDYSEIFLAEKLSYNPYENIEINLNFNTYCIQIEYSSDEEKQRSMNNPNKFIFLSTKYLTQIRDEAKETLMEIRSKI